jgi:hypothetical protein
VWSGWGLGGPILAAAGAIYALGTLAAAVVGQLLRHRDPVLADVTAEGVDRGASATADRVAEQAERQRLELETLRGD